MFKADILAFSMHLEDELFCLHQELSTGTYQHGTYKQFYVHDPKRRLISKASVRDRVVHQAIVDTIGHHFEKSFIHDTYSSLVGKGVHPAVNRLDKFLRQASSNGQHIVYALKCDISKYFDSIRHDILLSFIRDRIEDEKMYVLIEIVIRSFSSDKEKTRGLPLGNTTSQLFANVYLSRFDHWIKERLRMRWYVRFCDDFVILHKNKELLEQVLQSIQKYLAESLDLQLHPDKIILRKYSQGIDFLGQVLRSHCRTMRKKTRKRAVVNVRKLIGEYKNGIITDEEFRSSIQSYFGLLRHVSAARIRSLILDHIKKEFL